MVLVPVGKKDRIVSQTEPAYSEGAVWIEVDSNGDVIGKYISDGTSWSGLDSIKYPFFDYLESNQPNSISEGDVRVKSYLYNIISNSIATETDGGSFTTNISDVSKISNPSINLTGVTNTANKSVSGVGGSSSHSDSVSVGGTLDPTGIDGSGSPTVDLDLKKGASSSTPYGGYDSSVNAFGLSDAGNHIKSYFRLPNPPGTISEVAIGAADHGSPSGTLDIYISPGALETDYTSMTKVADDVQYEPQTTSNTHTFKLDQTYEVPSGTDEITIAFATESGNSAGDHAVAHIDNAASGQANYQRAQGGNINSGQEWAELTATGNEASGVVVETDSGATADFGTISVGGHSAALGMTKDTSSVSVTSTSSGAEIDYQLNYRERTETVDPVVELNGQTTSYDGILADGNVESLSIVKELLKDGDNTINISTNSLSSGPSSLVTVELEYEEEDSSGNKEKFIQEIYLSGSWN